MFSGQLTTPGRFSYHTGFVVSLKVRDQKVLWRSLPPRLGTSNLPVLASIIIARVQRFPTMPWLMGVDTPVTFIEHREHDWDVSIMTRRGCVSLRFRLTCSKSADPAVSDSFDRWELKKQRARSLLSIVWTEPARVLYISKQKTRQVLFIV